MTLLGGGSGRPIRSPMEDVLGRGAFVERLVDALISPKTRKSTGLTIGITGPWGSGKSSILNLVQAEIQQRYPDKALIVRFDPWLVSGRDDLIVRFFAEVGRTIRRSSATAERFGKLGRRLLDYAKRVAPAADLIIPGGATAISAGAAVLDEAFASQRDLHTLRDKLADALEEADGALVVLIDELDRVEDAEIRAMAQLVRAVLDFPGISFLLAYDAERVAQALGHGALPGQEPDHGRAYLEKIVQLQIPIPVLDDVEIRKLIEDDLGAIREELELPETLNEDQQHRYDQLIGDLCGAGIATLRDAKRLTGTFHALRLMLRREVDWIDLLAYAYLLVKAPRTAANIRDRWHLFVTSIPPPGRRLEERSAAGKLKPEKQLERANEGGEGDPTTRIVLQELFPIFTPKGGVGRPVDRLCHTRPLLMTSRLGLIPGDYSREEIETLLRADPEEVRSKLQAALDAGRTDALVDRLRDLYRKVPDTDHEAFWLGLAAFLTKPEPRWLAADDPRVSCSRNCHGCCSTW